MIRHLDSEKLIDRIDSNFTIIHFFSNDLTVDLAFSRDVNEGIAQ